MVQAISKAQWTQADDANAIAADLASAVEQNLKEAISDLGRASLVVSGGSTPLPFFKALSQAELDWSVVDVTLADERWVPEDHEDSNASFVKEHFLVGPASAANFYPMYRDKTAAYALKEVEQALSAMCQPFSVVILGMGSDGHTASLFPDTQGLEEAMNLDSDAMLAVLAPASVPQTRITLTRAALLQSRYRYLHITGQTKRDVLEAALALDKTNPGDEKPLPIASFFEKHLPPVSVYWSP